MTDTAIPRRGVCLPAPRHREIRGRHAKHIMRSRVTARRGRLGCGREKSCAKRPQEAFSESDWTPSTPGFEDGSPLRHN